MTARPPPRVLHLAGFIGDNRALRARVMGLLRGSSNADEATLWGTPPGRDTMKMFSGPWPKAMQVSRRTEHWTLDPRGGGTGAREHGASPRSPG